MKEAANDDHAHGVHPLKAWRERRGFPIAKAASLMGVTPRTWRAWEEEGVMPGHRSISKLFRLTRGKVSANSFVFPEGLPRSTASDT